MARSVPPLLRNLQLLAQSGLEHLVDDPALLAVQVSRRTLFPSAPTPSAGAGGPGDRYGSSLGRAGETIRDGVRAGFRTGSEHEQADPTKPEC